MSENFFRRFASATIKTINETVWDAFVRVVDARITAIEEKKASFEESEQLLIQLGLNRVNEALLPAFQTIQGIANLGAMLNTTSTTVLTVSTGVKQLTIAEADKDRFAPSAYIGLRKPGDNSIAMTGSTISYDRVTRTLTLLVEQVHGAGEFADWKVFPTATPDFGGRSDEEIITLVTGNADVAALINSLIGIASPGIQNAVLSAIRAGAPEAYDTLLEISEKLADDDDAIAALTAAIAGKVPLTRSIGVGGLATGGGTLDADRTITVPKASTAEAQAGIEDGKGMTPKTTKDAIAAQVPVVWEKLAAPIVVGAAVGYVEQTIDFSKYAEVSIRCEGVSCSTSTTGGAAKLYSGTTDLGVYFNIAHDIGATDKVSSWGTFYVSNIQNPANSNKYPLKAGTEGEATDAHASFPDRVRIAMNSGNIDAGTFTFFGRRR